MSRYRIAVDVGGTFPDIFVFEEEVCQYELDLEDAFNFVVGSCGALVRVQPTDRQLRIEPTFPLSYRGGPP